MAWNWKFWQKKPKNTRSFVMPELGDDVPAAVKQFLADNDTFLRETYGSQDGQDEDVEKFLDAVEMYKKSSDKHKNERDALLSAVILAVQHLEAQHGERKNMRAKWRARFAQITGSAAVGALLVFSGQLYFAAVHPPQEVASVNFPTSSVG